MLVRSRRRLAAALFLALAAVLPVAAQQMPRSIVEIRVVPDHAGWLYRVGQPVRFDVSVLRAGHPIEGANVRYELGPDLMPPREAGPLTLRDGRARVEGGTMTEPGFLRLTVTAEVDGREYQGAGTAGFDPQDIRPWAQLPDDFAAYWAGAIERARQVPLSPVLTPAPEASTGEVDVYEVSFQVDAPGSRFYGMLAVPKAPGRYPAILQVPGAGVRPYTANVDAARRGVIHLTVGVHGVPVRMEPRIYDALFRGPLANYWTFGLDDRDTYYYHRVVLGAVRAGDFLTSLPQFDGEHYGVYGSSQGGALAIATAALDDRIDALSAIHPAWADHEAFLHGRAGGWPHLFAEWNRPFRDDPSKRATARYYDTVNFARQVRVPGFYTFGYNDTVCPPTSMYAAYNALTAPKTLLPVPETAHWTYDEQWHLALQTLIDRFTKP